MRVAAAVAVAIAVVASWIAVPAAPTATITLVSAVNTSVDEGERVVSQDVDPRPASRTR